MIHGSSITNQLSHEGRGKERNHSKSNTKSKSKRCDDGRPRRSLSAYNLFFKMERERILKEQAASPVAKMPKAMKNKSRSGKHANVGFANLARIVADGWKNIDPFTKNMLTKMAREDKARYDREMEEWRKSRSTKREAKPIPGKAVSESVDREWPIETIDEFQFETVQPIQNNSGAESTSSVQVSLSPKDVNDFSSASSPYNNSFNPQLPFKVDSSEPFSSSEFCFPCSNHPSYNGVIQQSLLQPEPQDYLPGYSRRASTGTMPFPTHMDRFGFTSGYGFVAGGLSEQATGAIMPCLPTQGSIFSNQMYSNGPVAGNSRARVEDLFETDDVLRELRESNMKRRASMN